MVNKFWSIPVITVYVYAVTVISNIGYTGYFDIPMHYVGASIKSNIVFIKMLLDGVWVIGSTLGFLWILLIPFSLTVAFYTQGWWKYIGMVVLVWFLLSGATNLGRFVAKKQVTYLVPSDQCEQFKDASYVGVTANEGSFVFIKVDGNKILQGFYPVDASALSCGLVYKNLGPFVK